MHAARWKKFGSLDLPEKKVGPAHKNWAGGVSYDSNGYRRVAVYPGDMQYPEGRTGRVRIPEHRYVMGNHLGRPLIGEENVHHINGVRDDNRIENLELWIVSQPKGQRVEDQIEWAKELLATYEHLNYKVDKT
jgi:hypothetical protein